MTDYTTASSLGNKVNLKEYNEKGFVVLKNQIPEEALDQIINETHQVFKLKMNSVGFSFDKEKQHLETDELFNFFEKHSDEYVGCMKAIQNLPSLYKLGLSPELLTIVKQLGLKFPAYITKPLILLNSEKTSTQTHHWKIPVHQDWRSIQGSLNGVVVWVPLADVPLELGPVEVISTSHHRGLQPTEEDNWFMHVKEGYFKDEEFVPVPLERGDLVIFSMLLIHRSGVNKSNKIRYSIQYRYNDLFESTYVTRNFPNPYPTMPQRELFTENFPTIKDIEKIYG